MKELRRGRLEVEIRARLSEGSIFLLHVLVLRLHAAIKAMEAGRGAG